MEAIDETSDERDNGDSDEGAASFEDYGLNVMQQSVFDVMGRDLMLGAFDEEEIIPPIRKEGLSDAPASAGELVVLQDRRVPLNHLLLLL